MIRDAYAPPGGAEEEAGDEFWIRVPGKDFHAATEILGLDASVADEACPNCGAPMEIRGGCRQCGRALEPE